MTTYRKLAASSIAAIQAALERRMQRLIGDSIAAARKEDEGDERFEGEEEESYAKALATSGAEFFAGEIDLVGELLGKAHEVSMLDRKYEVFSSDLVRRVHESSPDEKLLIFTEYRATQDYLAARLGGSFGDDSIYLINGGMTYEEREDSIAGFEDRGLFLISTEAGGEGLNLHRKCHIMVNYDLPWNPMRLVQRIGRLYRYGQKKKVVVFNMHAPQTMDAQIMQTMYERINQVVSDMSAMGGEFRDGLEDEILGELAEILDVGKILEESSSVGFSQTQQRIDEALQRARQALSQQRELFEYAAGYSPDESSGELRIDAGHLRSFVEGMFRQLGIEVLEETHKGRVLNIRIPDELLEKMPGQRQRARITFDRSLAAARSKLHMMDMQSPLLCYLMDKAKSYDFDGICAGLKMDGTRAVITALQRWQNDQGMRMRQEYTVCLLQEDGRINTNPQQFINWLLEPANEASSYGGRDAGIQNYKLAIEAMDRRFAEVSSVNLHPENLQPVNAGWCSGVSQSGDT